MDILVMIWII